MQDDKYIGTVIWFDAKRGYGFISREDEKDLFIHWSDIQQEGFKTLKKGSKVAFAVGLNKRNQPKAIEVMVIDETSSEEKDR